MALDWMENRGLLTLLTSGSAEETEGFDPSDVLPAGLPDAEPEAEDEEEAYPESEYEESEFDGIESESEYEVESETD